MSILPVKTKTFHQLLDMSPKSNSTSLAGQRLFRSTSIRSTVSCTNYSVIYSCINHVNPPFQRSQGWLVSGYNLSNTLTSSAVFSPISFNKNRRMHPTHLSPITPKLFSPTTITMSNVSRLVVLPMTSSGMINAHKHSLADDGKLFSKLVSKTTAWLICWQSDHENKSGLFFIHSLHPSAT